MKNLCSKLAYFTILFNLIASASAFANNTVSITQPADGSKVSGPVKVCLSTSGVTVEPAKKGVHEGKGHHHILVDVNIPKDLSKPIGKDANHVHMGDGSTCKEIKLQSGKHTVRALYAKGNHVPYKPALTAEVTFNVK